MAAWLWKSQLARTFEGEVAQAIKQVPFQLGDDRPVYYSDWYRSQGSSERRKKKLFMKTKMRNQIFAKQVQDDLLALSDADLFGMIQEWVDGEAVQGDGAAFLFLNVFAAVFYYVYEYRNRQ